MFNKRKDEEKKSEQSEEKGEEMNLKTTVKELEELKKSGLGCTVSPWDLPALLDWLKELQKLRKKKAKK